MKRQPGLKITAQGIAPDWFPQALPALEKRRSEKKQESQWAAEQRDLITPEKVLEHFDAAERVGDRAATKAASEGGMTDREFDANYAGMKTAVRRIKERK